MKSKMLKIAGVKTEAQFYKLFPTQEAFMKMHGKEFKKAQMGAAVTGGSSGFKPINYSDQFDQADKMITGSTGAERQLALEKQQAAAAAQKGSGGGFDIGGLMKLAGSAGGEDITTAQDGGYYANNYTGSQTNFGQTSGPSLQPIQSVNQLKPVGSTNPLATGGIGGFDVSRLATQGATEENGWTKTSKALGKYAGPVGEIIGGIGALKQEKEAAKAAKQTKLVSDVSLQAAQSTDVDARRQMQDTFSKQRRAMMQPVTGESLFPVNGVGTNVLAKNGLMLQGGGEIQNTYDPYDIYDDSGYEPLNDSNVKQYYHGGRIHQMQDGGGMPWGEISHKATGIGQELMGGQNAGGQIGGTAGKAIGSIFGPVGGAVGEFVGGIAGNALDPYAKRIKKDTAATQRNMLGMASVNMAKGIQSQNQSYMEDGGWVSNDWQPQVIASFGGLDEQEVYDYAHEGMDTLRAGGHLRDYTPPSDRAMEIYKDGGQVNNYELGGVEVESGGYLEPISYNPNNAGTGITSMIRGQSHDDYDSKLGHSGVILNAYGNQVEAERGEPIREMEEGGSVGEDKSAVITGNLVYKNLNKMFDSKYDKDEGKKIKNIHKEIALRDQKLNKLEENNTKELIAYDPKTAQDKLYGASLEAKKIGYEMQYKNNAEDANYFTDHQTIINDTAKERGLVADDLARGKVKIDKEAQKQYAKFGGKFTKAQVGVNLPPVDEATYNNLKTLYDKAEKSKSKADVLAFQKEYHKTAPEYAQAVINTEPLTAYGKQNKLSKNLASNEDSLWGIRTKQYMSALKGPSAPATAIQPIEQQDGVQTGVDWTSKTPAPQAEEEEVDQMNPYINAFNQMLPYIRPSDQEELDASQLYPEMYAMATNQVEPVQANFYRPEIGVPYDISFQDQLDANQSDYRAAQRMMGYNPAAQANLNAQKYKANQTVLADQFRANQAMKDKVYGENRNILNDAKLKNLGIADQQYVRQSEALSNTKATTQAALNSIADKYAKNKLENRQLGVMENMYNYRYDSKGRAINMNPLQYFNMEGNGKTTSNTAPEGYEYETILKKKKEDKARNGSIVKSYKNL